jgi:ADP-ribosylglycohydrolase
MKALWLWWNKEALRIELKQLIEEGRDISAVREEFDRLLADETKEGTAEFQKTANILMDKGQKLPMRSDYAYVEPSDLKGIQKERQKKSRKVRIPRSKEKLQNLIYGAWLGRCAGCLHGQPLEGTLRTRLVKFLNEFELTELTEYVHLLPGLTEENCKNFNRWHGASPLYRQRTGIDKFPGDDDTNYTVLNMKLVKDRGIHFTPVNVADFWLSHLPLYLTCTAERVAYRNFANSIEPPKSASVRNPYREYIGAQIRADFFGYVALGNPRLAAELAWRDASTSHVKNGIYGEMWVAAMIATAAGIKDTRKLIDIALGEVPQRSRFFEGITEIVKRYDAGATYFEMLEYVHSIWNENLSYDWTHTIANAQIVAIGLLYGEGDYEKAMTRAVQICLDTDCNGATVGSIMGMILGAKALPKKWTSIMNDTIHTGVVGYDVVKISDLAKEMFEIYQKSRQELKRKAKK